MKKTTLKLTKANTILVDHEGNSYNARVVSVDNEGVMLEWDKDKQYFKWNEIILQANS